MSSISLPWRGARMHIVHTESIGALGGQSLRLIDEARLLVERRGHRCTVIGPQGSGFEAAARARIAFVPFRFHGGSVHPLDLAKALRILRDLAPDVVHTHSSSDSWTFGLAARFLSIPIVRGRHIAKPIPSSMFGRLVYTRLADAFTVSGRTIGRILVDAGVADPERVFDTPAGVDLARFDPSRKDVAGVRRELGIPPGARVVGTACNLRLMKGIDTLVDAHAALLDAGAPDLWLVHAGGGGPTVLAELSGKATRQVLFLGFRNDIERVLGALDLFVLASRASEGVPQAILQSMALRIPVLATRVGGIPDVVEDGSTGFLVERDDAVTLAARMTEILGMPASALETILDRARRMIVEEHTLERVVESYERAYDVVTR
jgi:glycosyltransferase involved in cell wall biosynthesis